MMNLRNIFLLLVSISLLYGCGKGDDGGSTPPPPPPPTNFNVTSWSVNTVSSQAFNYNVNKNPVIRFRFPVPINRSTVAANIQFRDNTANAVANNVTYENGDSVIVIQPSASLINL